jgi:ABC-type Mn2+/Zn2+ transport system ATPase subunit
MKTTKAKTTSKPKKTTKAGKTVKKKEVTTRKQVSAVAYVPTEDEIRHKANEVYYQRIARGEGGNPMDDWNKAIELLKDSKKAK